MYNKFLLSEKKLKAENIISEEQAEILNKRYSEEKKTNSSFVFPVICALFLAACVAVTVAAFWEIIPQGMKIIISFLTLISSPIAALFTILTK